VLLRLFNRIYYFLQGHNQHSVEGFDKFFFPLDAIGNWNRIYGLSGLIQYQCLLPTDFGSRTITTSLSFAEKNMCRSVSSDIAEGISQILYCCVKHGHHPWLAVLKRFGKREVYGDMNLSFPGEGYTITLDFPRRNGLLHCIAELDAIVLQMGGRVYLAKDCCLTPDTFKQMYPQWEKWQTVRSRLDPEHVFRSALSERLGLD
jgi:decaprenylphospho-beta-D-ribofuranose 2-oxidase